MSGPIFPYNSNVPQSNQYIRVTQQPILNDFQAIGELIAINHVGFNKDDESGKHTFTSFPLQVSDPTTGPTEIAVYCKETPSGPNSAEIFYRYPNNGAVVQLTSSAFASGYTLLAENGYAKIGEQNQGILWGKATGLTVGGTSINSVTLPGGANLNVQAGTGIYTPTGSFSASQIMYLMQRNISGTTFTLTQNTTGSQVSGPSVYWMIVGAFTV